MRYSAGELTERVTIRRNIRKPDAGGGYEDHWQNIRVEYALVRPLSGREREEADRTEAVANYLVVLRARRDITEADKIVWEGRFLNIQFIRARKARALYTEYECSMGVPV